MWLKIVVCVSYECCVGDKTGYYHQATLVLITLQEHILTLRTAKINSLGLGNRGRSCWFNKQKIDDKDFPSPKFCVPKISSIWKVFVSLSKTWLPEVLLVLDFFKRGKAIFDKSFLKSPPPSFGSVENLKSWKFQNLLQVTSYNPVSKLEFVHCGPEETSPPSARVF